MHSRVGRIPTPLLPAERFSLRCCIFTSTPENLRRTESGTPSRVLAPTGISLLGRRRRNLGRHRLHGASANHGFGGTGFGHEQRGDAGAGLHRSTQVDTGILAHLVQAPRAEQSTGQRKPAIDGRVEELVERVEKRGFLD